MSERNPIHVVEEKAIAREETLSCTPGIYAREILGIPDKVKGLTIVDLASGACPLVSDLLEEGADAYAIDIVYRRQPSELIESARQILYEQVEQAAYIYRGEMKDHGEEALEKFSKSFKSNREHYIAGYLTRLPLKNNISDITTSLNGITRSTDDLDLLYAMLNEALRITKPGGKVVISPIHTQYNQHFNYWARQHEDLISMLEEDGNSMETEGVIVKSADIPLPVFPRMTIIKR